MLNMDVPQYPYCDTVAIDRKLAILRDSPHLWRKNTMSFSLEAIGACFPDHPDFFEQNGSVGTSPAATASVLLRSESVSTAALDYLRSTILEDGGAPNVAPIDSFEAAWSLNYLRLAGAVEPDDPDVQRILDWLWSVWSPDVGIGFSSYYSVPNLDDTAVTFAVLRWGGYPVSSDVFGNYEEDDHFRCFPGEIDPSLSAHIRMISALRAEVGDERHEAWLRKAIEMLRRRNSGGNFWFDKWHASPYYLTCIAIQALRGLADELIAGHVRWITATQRRDGGWGHFGWSTPEETAYALLALLFWDDRHVGVERFRLAAAAEFLSRHAESDNLTPLWIGKCLYTPPNVVRSVILAALSKYDLTR
jgi:halimadienyl-diphosphate synthase